jgi:hypothetical protein
MATLVFTAIGTAIGGPLGGAIGALIGRQVDGAIIGSGSREGPRLSELSVTTSSYGAVMARHYGQMRVAGSIIWATDLAEHRDTSGGGKGKPSVTTYSYTASFAVALGSRPIASIGRIWADGNLLRGAAGDLKVGGQFRLYSGTGDQAPDSLLVAAEAGGACPAYRGVAYVVFEDLQLADFGNRIPALTFEVFGEGSGGGDALNIGQVVSELVPAAAADVALAGVSGFSCDGPLADLIDQLAPVFPVDCDVSGDVLSLRAPGGVPSELAEATLTTADDGFGGESGFARKRLPASENPPEIVRYYDFDRDYQPGLQRILGRPASGQPTSIELPVTTVAADAREMIEAASRRANWARQTLSWRTAQIDPEVSPGALVKVRDQPGIWRVKDWEWRASGVELTMERFSPTATVLAGGAASDPGRPLNAGDAVMGSTALVAFELPWDGTGAGDAPLVCAAASSAQPGWNGAALYLDQGDGQLLPLATSGRSRCLIGHVAAALPQASPHLFDRINAVIVQMIADDLSLQDASAAQLAGGANRALLGEEMIQFAVATPLGSGLWRLDGLLRGRGGTEDRIAGHVAGEDFVMLDQSPTVLDGATIGSSGGARIAAIGVIDPAPVLSPIHCRGLTQRPLCPVRPRVKVYSDGGRLLAWDRRARGAWQWLDGVDTPLHEEIESYDVVIGNSDAPLVSWTVSAPELEIPASQWAAMVAAHPAEAVCVRQRGSYAVSLPLLLTHLI